MALTKIPGELFSVGDLDISDVGTISLDAIQGDADSNTSITFSGSDVITIATGGSNRLTIGDGALSPVTDNQIDLGTSSLEFKDAFFDGTVTSDAFVGPLTGNVTGTADVATVATTVTITDNENTNETNAIVFTAGGDVDGGNIGLESDGDLTYNPSSGTLTATTFVGALTGNVTGNASGTAATVTGAAQSNITSLGTLTTLTVDNVIVNGTTIGHTDDTDLMTLADGVLTVAGEVDAVSLDISGNVDIDGTLETDNLTVGGAQGSDGQLLTSTGSGVAWEDAPSGGPTHKTFGTSSIMIGDDATGTINAANYNTGVGVDVFHDLTSGDDNSVFGYRSGYNISSGSGNTFFGYETGSSISTGQRNVVIGWKALDGGDTASDSVMIGYEAGGAVVDAVENVAVGYYAGAADMGDYNTFVGASAGQATTGTKNTFLGARAGIATTSGNGNIGIGYNALAANDSGERHVAIGDEALAAVTGGNHDAIAIGRNALHDHTTPGDCIAIGKYAMDGTNSASSTQCIAIGTSALGGALAGYGNVAVGYQVMDVATSAIHNTGVGRDALGALTSGNNNCGFGANAGGSVTSGGNNFFFGVGSGMTSGPGGTPGGAITTGNNEGVIGNGDHSKINVQVSLTVASDERDKTDFKPLSAGLNFVNQLTPYTYYWDKRAKYVDWEANPDADLNTVVHDGTHKEDWMDIGFKAQDVIAIEESIGHIIDDKTNLVSNRTGDGKQYQLQYEKFVPILVNAIQELSAEVQELKDKLKEK